MKLKPILVAAGLCTSTAAVFAGAASKNVAVSGVFTASCAILTTPIMLGTLDSTAVAGYVVQSNATYGKFMRVPTSFTVTCNSPTQTWRMGHDNGYATWGTIGSVGDNTFCFRRLIERSSIVPSCINFQYYPQYGQGSQTVEVDLIIRHSSSKSAFGGSGAINASVALLIEY